MNYALGQLVYDVDDYRRRRVLGDARPFAGAQHVRLELHAQDAVPRTTPSIRQTELFNIRPIQWLLAKFDDPNLDPRISRHIRIGHLLNHIYFPNYATPVRASSAIRSGSACGRAAAIRSICRSNRRVTAFSGRLERAVHVSRPQQRVLGRIQSQRSGRLAASDDAVVYRARPVRRSTSPNSESDHPDEPRIRGRTPSDPALKYLVLRPRPADNYYNSANARTRTTFRCPPATPATCKTCRRSRLRQLLDGPGLSRASDARRHEVQAALRFLVVDLDGRVNLNVHGNNHGKDTSGQPGTSRIRAWAMTKST